MNRFLPSLLCGLMVAVPAAAYAADGARSCVLVRTAFASGAYDQREAIVDALQDHMKQAGNAAALGRDGKVQAILLAFSRCEGRPDEDFMTLLDQASVQVAQERAAHRGD